LAKAVVTASACGRGVKLSSEPESSVGLKLPSQYEVDQTWLFASSRVPVAPRLQRAVIRAAGNVTLLELRDGKRKLKSRKSEWTSPVPFGPELEPRAMPGVPDLFVPGEEPGRGILGYRERRLIEVTCFKEHDFPFLDFIGYWNHTRFSTSSKLLFAEHLGVHFHERFVHVRIPADLVNEMKEWWNHRIRDEDGVNYGLSVARCRVLTSELAITADELRVATLYAPAIAFIESWEEQQNVSRALQGSYLRSAVAVSITKLSSSLSTSQGRVICVGISGLVFGMCAIAYRYRVSIRFALNLVARACSRLVQLDNSLARWSAPVRRYLMPDRLMIQSPSSDFVYAAFPSAARLVGIELNPGPTFGRSSRRTRGVTCRAFQIRDLVNCVELPRPRRLKPGAKLKLSGQELRPPLNLKGPLSIKGRHVTYGFDTKQYAPTGFASNEHNEKQALLARVLCDTDIPTEDLASCLQWCKRNHRELFPHMHRVRSVAFEEYLRRSNASPSVKRVLQQTMTRMQTEGVSEDTNLTRSQLYRYTYRSSFVKVENDLYTSPAGRKNKAPRLIQGAQPEFICIVGPWIMALQDSLKRAWSSDNNICFTSGVTAEAAAKHITDGYGPWLEDDLGKFDSSIRSEWCEYEVWLCRKFGAPRAVLDLMTANIATHGSTLHGWKYKCDGTRRSGDPYTSLMNSIINGLSHAYLYCKWTGKSAQQMRLSLRMLVQGDDNCMRHQENVEFPWREGMSGLGFDSEAIYRNHFFEVEFCSCRLYAMGDGVTFGPKPGRVIAKMGYVINPPANVTQESMMRGIALGLVRATSFIPPLRSTVNRILELTDGHSAWFDRKLLRHTAFATVESDPLKMHKLHVATVDTMLSLNVHYDWDYGKQMCFDEKLRTMQLGDVMDGFSELLLDRDTSGPQCIFGGWVPQLYCAPVAA